jgi:hypothetical protein
MKLTLSDMRAAAFSNKLSIGRWKDASVLNAFFVPVKSERASILSTAASAAQRYDSSETVWPPFFANRENLDVRSAE